MANDFVKTTSMGSAIKLLMPIDLFSVSCRFEEFVEKLLVFECQIELVILTCHHLPRHICVSEPDDDQLFG